jgi:hypothetical protein
MKDKGIDFIYVFCFSAKLNPQESPPNMAVGAIYIGMRGDQVGGILRRHGVTGSSTEAG